MSELYTAAQLVLFPFVVLASIIGAASVVHMVTGVITGDAWKLAMNLMSAAACTVAVWAYLMIPGGLG